MLITGNTVESNINQIKGCPDIRSHCLAAALGSGGRAITPLTVDETALVMIRMSYVTLQ